MLLFCGGLMLAVIRLSVWQNYYPGVLFWSAKTSDLTKSNMLKLSSKPIYKEMTIRMFNTTRKIYEMMRGSDRSIV